MEYKATLKDRQDIGAIVTTPYGLGKVIGMRRFNIGVKKPATFLIAILGTEYVVGLKGIEFRNI